MEKIFLQANKYDALKLDERHGWSDDIPKEPVRRRHRQECNDEYEGNPNATICWHCKNAVPIPSKNKTGFDYGCNWSIHGQPVLGWIAFETQREYYTGPSYNVRNCPEFVRG